ncbi:helix-turn-helix domain-containing protein [Haladaptatus sp. DYF46]|uniref:helix-turn-helix domain-containing protein n=1 Tax=Haladaptatus sp. DYF46 TaxID=2886041 RepID=UPI001E2833C1|nr:helix-turn-helix domain-containing protein [Haladaptatus sp. DYF46]
MIIVEFRLDYPILREALGVVPEMEITWEQSDRTAEGRHQILFWAENGDFDAFEGGLESDPTVATSEEAIEISDQRLYRVELKDEGQRASIYPVLLDEASVLRHVTATHRGWEFRTAFPTKEGFSRFCEHCRSHEIGIVLHRFYEERGSLDTPQFGLTDPQRETLVTAVDCGYLEIPRENSLADLSDRFDISETAASERFRRGVKTLIECTVYPDDERT